MGPFSSGNPTMRIRTSLFVALAACAVVLCFAAPTDTDAVEHAQVDGSVPESELTAAVMSSSDMDQDSSSTGANPSEVVEEDIAARFDDLRRQNQEQALQIQELRKRLASRALPSTELLQSKAKNVGCQDGRPKCSCGLDTRYKMALTCHCAAQTEASTAERKTCCDMYKQNPEYHTLDGAEHAEVMSQHVCQPMEEEKGEEEEEKKGASEGKEETEERSDPCTEHKPGSDKRGQCCKDHFEPMREALEKKLASVSSRTDECHSPKK